MLTIPPYYKPSIIIVALVVIWTLETAIPMMLSRRNRVGHNLKNILLATINALIGSALFLLLLKHAIDWTQNHNFGLINWLNLQGIWAWVVSLLLFDCWQYWWHRINHRVPLFWRFHAVHHADRDMDASTGQRFHFIEITYSFFARLIIIPLIGMELQHLLVYELISIPIIIFHHGNIAINPKLDRILRIFIVTPYMHFVHHSDHQPETDSNYSSFLSIWDRIFGSFRLRDDPRTITLGLKNIEHHDHHDFKGMLTMPFKHTAQDTDAPAEDHNPSDSSNEH